MNGSNDIGIDLGTATVLICDPIAGILLEEPSVVAVNIFTDEVLAVGDEANRMLGRTPGHVRAVMPLQDGVISDFDMTAAMITGFIRKLYQGSLVRPRVAVCVPSGITGVESQAVVDTAVKAGARKVYLIEEPVAAAIGAGIDITKPNGNIIVDIGGGTTDIAVLSFSGIVCKSSIKVAGRKMDIALVRYLRRNHSLLIGEKSAEKLKIQIGSVFFDEATEDIECEVRGKDMISGLPSRRIIKRSEIQETLLEYADEIIHSLQKILEVTPPELSSDIYNNGVLLTGGGALLHGLDQLITKRTGLKVNIPENPRKCVAIGTAGSFKYLGELYDGFVNPSVFSHN